MADETTSNYGIPLPKPKGLQQTEIQKVADAITTIDGLVKTLDPDGTKETPVDDDSFIASDSEASGAKKLVLWSRIKSVLKSYFDGFYLKLTGGTLSGSVIMHGGNYALDNEGGTRRNFYFRQDDGTNLAYVGFDETNTLLEVVSGSYSFKFATSGALIVPGIVTDDLHVTTKTYVDTAGAKKLNLSGGTLTGALTAPSLTINGTLSVGGQTSLGAALSGTSASFSSTFAVTGTSTFSGKTTHNGGIAATAGTFSTTLSVTGTLTASSSLSVAGTSSLTGAVTFGNNYTYFDNTAYNYLFWKSSHVAFVKATGSYNFYWRTSSDGTSSGTSTTLMMLDDDAKLTLSGALSVAGASSLASTLAVSGTSTFTGKTTHNGGLGSTSGSFSTTLSAAGTATFTGTAICQYSNGNIGSNITAALEVQPGSGANTDTFMSFHIPTDSRRVNIGLRPSSSVSSVLDAFGIGGGTIGAAFYKFYNSSHFGVSTDANVILAGSSSVKNVYSANALLAAINSRASASDITSRVKSYLLAEDFPVGSIIFGVTSGSSGDGNAGETFSGSVVFVMRFGTSTVDSKTVLIATTSGTAVGSGTWEAMSDFSSGGGTFKRIA